MRYARCVTVGVSLTVALAFGAAGEHTSTSRPAATTRPADTKPKPKSNLDYWLETSSPASSRPAVAPAGEISTPPPENALPGVIELSDGTQLGGWMFTTRRKPWRLWVPHQKRWRRIPFIHVLSITAVVVEEKMVRQWRWKATGVPERFYTGLEYPTRRLQWTFHLIDDSTITGDIKGQPVWSQLGETKTGPLVLHERARGQPGQALCELVYVRRIIVSRKMMDRVISARSKPSKTGTSAPAR